MISFFFDPNCYQQFRLLGFLISGLVWSLPVFVCQAQDNYLSSYIVKNEGDTVHGLVEYRDWVQNPSSIRFKTSSSGTVTTFGPADIASFMVTGKDLYVSKTVDFDISPWEVQDLTAISKLKEESRTLFLRVLVLGSASLYRFVESSGRPHFFIEKDGIVDGLQLSRSLTDNNKVLTTERYKGQLTFYFQDCLPRSIRNSSYSSDKLISIFRAYNTCRDPLKDEFADDASTLITFQALAGVSFSTMSFNSAFPHLDMANFNWSAKPMFGLGMGIALPGKNYKYGFDFELFYRSFNVEAQTELASQSVREEYDINFNNTHLQLSTSFVTKSKEGPARAFLTFGPLMSILLKDDNTLLVKTYNTSGFIRAEEGPVVGELRGLEFGVGVGFGVQANRISVFFRYQQTSGVSKLPAIKSTPRSVLVMAKYTISN